MPNPCAPLRATAETFPDVAAVPGEAVTTTALAEDPRACAEDPRACAEV